MFHNPASVLVMGYDQGFAEPLWDSETPEIPSFLWGTTVVWFGWAPVLAVCTPFLLDPYSGGQHWRIVLSIMFGLGLAQFLLLRRALQDDDLNSTDDLGGKMRLHHSSKCLPHWLDGDNTLAISSMLLDFYQVFALAIVPSVFPEEAPTQTFFQLAFLDIEVGVSCVLLRCVMVCLVLLLDHRRVCLGCTVLDPLAGKHIAYISDNLIT